MRTVIIGGVAGGASAAARLRRLREKDEIILIDRGDYISFANCGLPYYIGGEIKEKHMLTLQTPESFRARFNVDVRIKNEVVKIEPDEHRITVKKLDTGEAYDLCFDRLILSPGAEPLKPSIEGVNL
ncbi:MAG: FAD-dependent oxidoreductase, partial [Ruminococcus sp.]|uniref:NAD(P)/FAD-dependent oxidoreductase n=1 Tax=Ruminococcus sp. TaxID=41978 RepID=UPI0025DF05D0